jgi:hypothetical protein
MIEHPLAAKATDASTVVATHRVEDTAHLPAFDG